MRIKDAFALVAAVGLSEAAGIVGSIFSVSAISSWYHFLNKPLLNPPSWVFAPVWTTLYVLMGIAAFLVWKKGIQHKKVKIALLIFLDQLIFNMLWSIIFFGLNTIGLALAEICLLWGFIMWTIFAFVRISKPAAWLLLPYILWVSFAAYLNFSLWLLN